MPPPFWKPVKSKHGSGGCCQTKANWWCYQTKANGPQLVRLSPGSGGKLSPFGQRDLPVLLEPVSIVDVAF